MTSRAKLCLSAVIILGALFTLGVITANADTPKLINYQGVLKSGGTPVTTTVSVVFNLWNNSAGGASFWTETQNVTPDADGCFNVTLGSVTSIPASIFWGTNVYLGVKVGLDAEMTPRQRLVATGYAFSDAWGEGNTAHGLNATVGGGFLNTASGLLATVGGGIVNTSGPGESSTVGGGGGNTASLQYSTVGGGRYNKARNEFTVVAGGGGGATSDSNSAIGYASAILGGQGNIASGDSSCIGGGTRNTASGVSSVVGGGVFNYAQGNSATIAGGNTDTASGIGSTIGGGYRNAASGEYTAVGGGLYNKASGLRSTVGGGSGNKARNDFTVVAGGGGGATSDSNSALGYASAILGGQGNIASGDSSCVGGGTRNTASGTGATVSGGYLNTAIYNSTVGGGWGNNASGYQSTVPGGTRNTANGQYSTVGGGKDNTSGPGATVGGGVYNTASGENATVGGGYDNTASGSRSTVGGGRSNAARGVSSFVGGGGPVWPGVDLDSNAALGSHSSILGGAGNTASGDSSCIGGGTRNRASGRNATVGGGNSDTASGSYSTVGGGQGNTAGAGGSTVSGGYDNSATGPYATVSGGTANIASGISASVTGGEGNTAGGSQSQAGGFHAKALNLGSFVWADATTITDFTSTASNQFLIRAGGGVGIGTNTPAYALDVSGDIGTSGDLHMLSDSRIVNGDGRAVFHTAWNSTFSDFTAINSGYDWTVDEPTSVVAGRFGVFFTKGSGGVPYTSTLAFISPAGNMGIGTTSPTQKLHVSGNICYTGSIAACSDARYKTGVTTITNSLDKVTQLRGVRYKWRQDEYPERDFDNNSHLGFIGQEIETLFPEIVLTDGNGYKSVDYSRLTPVLVEAIKDLKAENDSKRSRIDQLEAQMAEMRELLNQLAAERQ